MLRDAALPPVVPTPPCEARERAGVRWQAASWQAGELERVVTALAAAVPGLAELSDDRLLTVWVETVARFRDPDSADRRALAPALAANCRLSPEGLAAGLEAVLGGVDRGPAERLFAEAARRGPAARAAGGPVLVVLASNLPGLAVQPLLTLVALRRPVLLKSPSAEPLFAAAFVAALAEREPRLAAAGAAVTWPGGDRDLEAAVLPRVERVLAYGEQESLDDLERRAPGKVVGYGPKTSLAIVGREAVNEETAAGLARDIALFDQRGCLSIAAVYTDGDANELGRLLAAALSKLAERWPPGPPTAAELAGVQQVRAEAEMRSLKRFQVGNEMVSGTVIVEERLGFSPSPGLRTVRVHHLPNFRALAEILAPWHGRLQGAALAGDSAWELVEMLTALGISRCAAPGDLQSPDALWHNGGVHPLELLIPRPDPSLRSG
jgi:hypothetical protein